MHVRADSQQRDIRIDYPGDGEWVMEQAGGAFNLGPDHCVANARGGRIMGGFAFTGFMGNAISVHMAGHGDWCSRTLMWMAFDYGFNQLGCHKLLAPVPSDNHRALELDLRAGWHVETLIRDVVKHPDGSVASLFILGMTRDQCKWLRVPGRNWMRELACTTMSEAN